MYTILYHFLPLLLFVTIYVGSGLYFSWIGIAQAFYQVSPVVAILPALVLAWIQHRGSTTDTMNRFLDGIRHRDIITMCLIFMLAGALSVVTTSIGSVEATVNCALTLIPAHLLLIGVFLATAFIATAIGTSMGTIATLGPLAAGLAHQGAFPIELGMATVVGGAMFGDNLSLISDTTIAAVLSQGADFKKKLQLNGMIAGIAGLSTIVLLFGSHNSTAIIAAGPYSLLLLTPYLLLIAMALMGINVFIVLMTSLGIAGAIGIIHSYTLLAFCNDIARGFASMHEIMTLSLLVGGLSGLTAVGAAKLSAQFAHAQRALSARRTQAITAGLVALFDLLLANNTIAIIFCGDIIKEMSKATRVPAHYSAAWLDIFSCVVQGIIPYGAQVLLASSIGGISPLQISGSVYYCYMLAIAALGYIMFNKKTTLTMKQYFTMPVGVALILEHNRKILLIKRGNVPLNPNVYSVVAGHIDGNESAITALVREAREEIGIAIDPHDLSLVHTAHITQPAYGEVITLYFKCSRFTGTVENKEPHKHTELIWTPINQLPSPMLAHVGHALNAIEKNQLYSDWGF